MNGAVSTVNRDQLSWWTFLTQGAAAGMLLCYVSLVISLESYSRYYHPLIVGALPRFLAFGFAIGGLKGVIIWACAKMIRHRLGWLLRSTIASVVFHLIAFVPPFSSDVQRSSQEWVIGSTVVVGLTFGLVIGSRLQPWQALVRASGTIGPKSATLAGLTSIALRLGILFLFLFFGLIFLSVMQSPDRLEFRWIALITIHLTLSLIIVFIKMKLWLLATSAVLINTPVVMLLTEFQRQQLGYAWYVLIGYLALWAMFLLTRWRQTYRALSVFGEELRYYLID